MQAEAARKSDVYGLLSIAGVEIALPLSNLREVVPCPEALAPLPVSAPGLLGAIQLREVVLPVLDIRAYLDRAPERNDAQIVVVITNGNHQIGLLADRLRTVSRVSPDVLTPIRSDELLFKQTFYDKSGDIISVLDVEALLQRPGLPLTDDLSGQVPVVAKSGEVKRTKYTLLRCGAYVFALDVAYVHTTMPVMPSTSSVLTSSLCRGVTSYLNYDVPLIDPLELMGLGTLPSDKFDAGLVLKIGDGYVMLALSELLQIVELSDEDVMAVPSFALPRSEFVVGIADSARQCIVLDGAALVADSVLGSYAKMNTETVLSGHEATDAFSDVQVLRGLAHLRYSIGVDIVTPLGQVAEILPYPTEMLSTNANDSLVGVISHRGDVVPVMCLATLLNRVPSKRTDSSCLLLVAVHDQQLAFVVDTLRSIDPLAWEDPQPKPGTGSPSLDKCALVQVGSDTTLLPQLDLEALAASIQTVSNSH